MIFNTHTEFVVFDIGEKYIKAMLVRTNWDGTNEYVYATKSISKGIIQNNIVNLRALSDALFQIIYRVEIDVGTSIKSVIVLFSFGDFKIHNFNTSLDINGIVKETHLQNINYRLNFGLNKTILGYFYKNYRLDSLLNIDNPLHMCGSKLSISASFLSIETEIVRNLIASFNRNEIDVNFIGCSNLVIQELISDDNCVFIDVGYSTTRILVRFKSDNIYTLIILQNGFKDLVEILQKSIKNCENPEKHMHVCYEECEKTAVDVCRKFFKNLFYVILHKLKDFEIFVKDDVPIFLYGGISMVPLIDLFLQQSFDKDFRLLEVNQKFSCIYNRNVFCSIIAASIHVTKSQNIMYLSQINI